MWASDDAPLRKQNAQERIEGREPFSWKDADYAVLDDETRIGRIYREQLPAGETIACRCDVGP